MFVGPAPGDPRHRPHLLQEVMRTSQALLAVFSREVGMPASRLALLRLLAIAGPPGRGVMRMARDLGVNPAAVTRAVQDLRASGLVAVSADPADARRKTARLTEAGLGAFQRVHDRGHQFEHALAGDVSAQDIATTMRVLARLRARIEALAGGAESQTAAPVSGRSS